MSEKKFVKIKCSDCENEQVTFKRLSKQVDCQVCGASLAKPTGGRGKFEAEVIEEIEPPEEGGA